MLSQVHSNSLIPVAITAIFFILNENLGISDFEKDMKFLLTNIDFKIIRFGQFCKSLMLEKRFQRSVLESDVKHFSDNLLFRGKWRINHRF